MKIRITSISCDDLPNHYLQNSWYKVGKQRSNFYVGCERDVYAIAFADTHLYFIRSDPDTPHLNAYPAALTEIINDQIPDSWVVSHETKALHPKLPDHQVVFCPRDWLTPYFSIFVDRLGDECQRELQIFLESALRDYPSTT